ncbi:MAG: hypothetical protein ACP5OZ_02435 [Candidatus Woesearchaeota archaeon]
MKNKKGIFNSNKFFILFCLTLFFINSAHAVNIGYVVVYESAVKTEHINVLNELGFNYDIIIDSQIPTANFSKYDAIIVADTYFTNYAKIPVNNISTLILNSYHLDAWHWSKKSSVIVSNYPLTTNIINFSHYIVKNFTSPIQIYTKCCYGSSTVGIPAYYLSRFDKSGYLSVITSTLNNDNDGIIITAVPGTRLRDGYYSNAKGVFFGIPETEYWTNNSRELFKRSLLWLVRDEIPPVITLLSPVSKTYTTNNILINFTLSEPATCYYSLDSSSKQMITAPYYVAVSEGPHYLTIECYDYENNSASVSVSFSVDTIAPNLSVLSPEEQKYYPSSQVQLIVNSDFAYACSYSLNRAANQSIPGNGTYWSTMISGIEGSNNLIVYCMDEFGNAKSKVVNFFIDTTMPIVVDFYHSPQNPTELDLVSINAEINELNFEEVKAYYRVNYGAWNSATMSPSWNVNIGSFNSNDFVEYYIFVKDKANNNATTSTKNFTVGKSDNTPPNMPLNLRAEWLDGNSIIILWDEPSGEKPSYYNIYISDNPYAELSSFDFLHPNASVIALNYTDTTAGFVRRRFYIVRSVDSSGNEDNNTFRFGKFDLELNQGMNLVSLPLIPFNNSIFKIMHQSPSYNPISEVMRRKNLGEYDIATFYIENPPNYWWSSTDFYSMENGTGYWFKSKYNVNFTITGAVATQTQNKLLNSGMNLVGLTSLYDYNLWDIIVQTPADYSVLEVMKRKQDGSYMIATYYPQNPPHYWWSYDNLKKINPGIGYWFKTNKACNWNYDPEP